VTPSPADWVAIAILGKTRGNRGEITAVALSDKPERYEELTEVFVFRPTSPPGGERFAVEEVWFHSGTLVFKLEGVESIGEAELLYGSEVRLPISQRISLEDGEFFQSDLIGCEVVDHGTGASLGRVKGWDDGGGTGLLVVDDDLLIPFARAICVEINPAAKRISVVLPEGLKDLNRP
jgi:16S rRNA processing protein RimM